MDQAIKVLYFAHSDETMYQLVRHGIPDGVELVTLTQGTDAERLARIADADVVVLAGRRLDDVFLDAAKHLKLIVMQGVGYHDYVDIASVRRRGLALTISPAGTGAGVAEHTIMLMLAVGKRLPWIDSKLREGVWLANNLRAQSSQLYGKTVGIVGFGRIGQEVARRLLGWNVTLVYHDIADISTEIERETRAKRLPLDDLLTVSDVVTLHVPLTQATRHMMDGRAFQLMKPGSMLINCARGPVVDESALVDALQRGHLGGAGLDVYEIEPPPAPMALSAFHNVVLTPHNAPGTADIMRMKMEEIWSEISLFFRAEAMKNQVA